MFFARQWTSDRYSLPIGAASILGTALQLAENRAGEKLKWKVDATTGVHSAVGKDHHTYTVSPPRELS